MIMSWDTCEAEFVRKTSVDTARISSLCKTSQIRFNRAKQPFEGNISFALEDYYEAIKEVLVAFMLSKGFKSSNHQCLISFYLKETKHESDALLIQRMSFYRNRLTYYGEEVPSDFVVDNENAFVRIFEDILRRVKG